MTLKQLNILIRCDASIQIGWGHVTRCLVLANELKSKGHNIYFALKDHVIGIKKVEEQGFQYFLPSSPFNYHSWITSLATQLSINIFIGDIRDGLTINTIDVLKQMNILTVAIDEPSDYRKACDLCFYPPHAQIDKLSWTGFNGEIKQGLQYILLRPEFYHDYPYKKPSKTKKILIMMGGTDHKNLTLPLINKLLNMQAPISINVIISPSHPDIDEINNKAVTNYSNIKDMAHFLTAIDYAIISFGSSAYELIALKIPATHICFDDDHIQSSQYFQKHKLAQTLAYDRLDKIPNMLNFSLSIESNTIPASCITDIVLETHERHVN